jgi:tRNA (guanine37-N1)-methyltransferase
MKIDILTMHPDLCVSPIQTSIIGRAQNQGLVEIKIHNLHDFGLGKYQQVDDSPYGGGAGMVLRVDVVAKAVESIATPQSTIILLEPSGQPYKQKDAQSLVEQEHLVFICGHYEGLDDRIRSHIANVTFSIGDYVLTGGELPALVVIDSIVRLLPGALGNEHSIIDESFQNGLLEAPVYTRPRTFGEWTVPDVLLSGHHENINKWRRNQSVERTKQVRPDLWEDWSNNDK